MTPFLLAFQLLAAPAVAHDVAAAGLKIGHPYAIETPPGAMSGAGYLTIVNEGAAPDRLVAVRADFPQVTLHRTEIGADGVARMRPAEGIAIAPGETVTFAPGGSHVMFMGLEGDPFEVGEVIPATLVFEKAGEVAVEFWVQPRGAAPTGHGPGDGADHGADHGAAAPHAAAAGHGQGVEPADRSHLPDPERITALLQGQFDRPDAPLTVAPIVVRGDVAVAGWSQDGQGGRAFLRRKAGAWTIELCSGESLRQVPTFQALGLSAPEAEALAADVAAAEAGDPALTARLDAFEGTILIGQAGR
jgi:copper(I)-binding protein